MKKKILILLIILIGFGTVKAFNNNTNMKNLYKPDVNNLFNLNKNMKKYYKIKNNNGKFVISESNIAESNINYDYLLKSDKEKINNLSDFNIVDNDGTMYLFNKDKIMLNKEVDYLSVYNDDIQLILTYDSETLEWIFKYPSVLVSSGLVNKYYINLNDAFNNAIDDDVIILMRNQTINNSIVLDKNITIDGNGYQIKSNSDYLFKIGNSIDKINVTINNVNLYVNSFIKVNNNLDNVYLNDVNVSYKKIGIDNKYSNKYIMDKNTIFSLPLN